MSSKGSLNRTNHHEHHALAPHQHLPAEHSVSHTYVASDSEKARLKRYSSSHEQKNHKFEATKIVGSFSNESGDIIRKQWNTTDVSSLIDEETRGVLEYYKTHAVGAKLVHLTVLQKAHIAIAISDNRLVVLSDHSEHTEIPLPSSSGLITFATMVQLSDMLYIVISDDNGVISVFCYDHVNHSNKGHHKLIATYSSPAKHAVKSITHQSIAMLHRNEQNILYLWIAYDNSLSLIGCKLHDITTPSFSGVKENTSLSIKIEQYLNFKVDSKVVGDFQHSEVFNTNYGSSSCLAVHYTKTTADGSFASVFTLDCRLVLHFVEKMRCNQVAIPATPLSVGPIYTFPFVSHKAKQSTSTKSNSMFSLTSTQSTNTSSHSSNTQIESLLYSSVCQDSIHTVSVADYSSFECAISKPAFSFKVILTGSVGTKVLGSVETSQETIARHICTLREKAFLTPETKIDCALSIDYVVIDPRSVTHDPLSTDPDPQIHYAVSETEKSLLSISLWRACLLLELVTPARLNMLRQMVGNHDEKYALERQHSGVNYDCTVEKQQERLLGRLIVMETALICGLSQVLSEYIEARNVHNNGYDIQFILSDVKRVHEWAVPTTLQYTGGLPSVLSHVEALSRDLTLNYIVPLLLNRQSRHPAAVSVPGEISRGVSITIMNELESHIAMCRGIRVVVESLIRRKLLSIDSGNAENRVTSSDIMYGVIEEATTELRIRLTEINCILHILEVLHTLCIHPHVSLNCLLDSAVGQSLYSTATSDRKLINDDLKFVPDALYGGLLFDELCQLLLDKDLKSQTVLSQSKQLVNAVATFLFLPLAALKNATTNVSSVMLTGASPEDVEVQLVQAMQIGQSVVLHFLLDMYLLSHDRTMPLTNTAGSDDIRLTEYGMQLGYASHMPDTLVKGVIALFKIDASYCVDEAVADITNTTVTNIVHDDAMLLAVLKRIICSNHLDNARTLTSYLIASKHTVMSTQIGVLSHATVWNESRKLCSSLRDYDIATTTKAMLIQIVAKWSRYNGELTHFLTAPMDRVEVQSVIYFLSELAYEEIQCSTIPSPCVDLCMSYLLKMDMYTEALKIHDDHEKSIKSQSLAVIRTASVSLNTRKTMLNAYKALPKVTGLNIGSVTGVVSSELIQAYQSRSQVLPAPATMPTTVFSYREHLLQTPHTQYKHHQHHVQSSGSVSGSGSEWHAERVQQRGVGDVKRIRFENVGNLRQ